MTTTEITAKAIIKKRFFVIAFATLGVAIAAWLLFTLIVPSIKGDGTQGLQGAAYEFGKRAVALTRDANNVSPMPGWYLQVNISDVHFNPVCEGANKDDKNDYRNYSGRVTLSHVFNFDARAFEIDGCTPLLKAF